MSFLLLFPFDDGTPNAQIWTAHGPITKGWGDDTLADSPLDVSVTINGVPATVLTVDPLCGIIGIEEIPSPGDTVLVDYHYIKNPVEPMTGLNDPCQTLNTYGEVNDRRFHRFQYSMVLLEKQRDYPVLIDHQYRAYERAYTASLNDPTTLLLNRSNHHVNLPPSSRDLNGFSVFYDANYLPENATPPWDESGAGDAFVSGGRLTLVDDTTGPPPGGKAHFFYRDEEINFNHFSILAWRTQLTSYTPTGVFTGVAAGYTDADHLYMVGLLDVGGFKQVGLFKKPDPAVTSDLEGDEASVENWILNDLTDAEISSATRLLVNGNLPSLFVGQRLRVVEGPNEGVYAVSAFGIAPEGGGLHEVILDSSLPDPAELSLIFTTEVSWDTDTSYRLTRLLDGSITLHIDGYAAPSISATLDEMPDPVEVTLQLGYQQFFFGSLSTFAANVSEWDLFRYAAQPEAPYDRAHTISVQTEMNVVPEDDPNYPWELTGPFGSSIILGGDFLSLDKSSATGFFPEKYGYERIEPFLTKEAMSTTDFRFRASYTNRGLGNIIFDIEDDEKEIRFAPVLYAEVDTAIWGVALSIITQGVHPMEGEDLATHGLLDLGIGLFNFPVDLYADTYAAMQYPDVLGWTPPTSGTVQLWDHLLEITQGLGDDPIYTKELPELVAEPQYGFSTRMAIRSTTPGGSGNPGPIFGVEDKFKTVAVAFRDGGYAYLTSDGTPVSPLWDVGWDDNEMHLYRVIKSSTGPSAVVSLFVDGVFVGAIDYNLFTDLPDSGTPDAPRSEFFGTFETDVESVTEWDHWNFYLTEIPLVTLRRTVGLFKGGDQTDMNNWWIPRLNPDPLVPNNSVFANLVQIDWLTYATYRIQRDSTGEVVISYQQGMGPVEELVRVDYKELPDKAPTLASKQGRMAFGSERIDGIATSEWDFVRYNISKYDESIISPHHHLLNQYNVMFSPEHIFDTTPEEVLVTATSSTTVSLMHTGLQAARVLDVREPGGPSLAFLFDDNTQIITLFAPLSSSVATVQVTMVHKDPPTIDYLRQETAFTRLNEGTPIVPIRQEAELQYIEEFASQLNNPDDVLNIDGDFTLNDGTRRLVVTVEGGNCENLYRCLEVISQPDDGQTGLIKPACDEGIVAMEMDGFEDEYEFPGEECPGGEMFYLWSPVRNSSFLTNPDDRLLGPSIGHCPNDPDSVVSALVDTREDVYAGASDGPVTIEIQEAWDSSVSSLTNRNVGPSLLAPGGGPQNFILNNGTPGGPPIIIVIP